ncbi:MAG: hypothetical protein NT027_09760 [Proteobacteria bacterium]|nr:hypothetical protein [Pseudomonadota bacterium]
MCKGPNSLIRRLLTFSIASVVFAPAAFSQRLTIDSTSTGPVSRVVYGRVFEGVVSVFEKNIQLEPLPDGSQSSSNESENVSQSDLATADQGLLRRPKADNQDSVPIKVPTVGSNRVTIANFKLQSSEMDLCTKHPRWIGFMAILASLKTRINTISFSVAQDSEECGAKLLSQMKSKIPGIEIEESSDSEDGVLINLGVASTVSISSGKGKADSDKDGQQNVVTLEALKSLSTAELAKLTQVSIDGNVVPVTSEGFFVLELNQSVAVPVTVKVQGFRDIKLESMPNVISNTVTMSPSGRGYSQRIAVFNQNKLRIYLTQVPLLEKKTSIDSGFGGGIGYGREVPGERRGQRLVGLAGIERREMLGALGLKLSGFLTSASSTVVPQTTTVRAASFMDFSFFEGSLLLRTSAGFEMFLAQIKRAPLGANSPEVIYIPQQVLAPLMSVMFQSFFQEKYVLSMMLTATPLYVPNYGMYTSYSPHTDLGYKISKDWVLLFQFGSEVHRYPSTSKETRLQLDYGLFTLKRGLF